ncbi:DUF2853 family protein [Sphingomonas cannabina]|uniref:DUF2853 family protein n=1 Tax=Sphingomonas cannabina TaxID=2899123 RepID=UPI001F43FB09|nr:DUF2853 family protein [Sphingomonas cannabina]UIJ46599.1 DUF2853 family protein [Sphingomonas cannabina]
MAEDWIADVRRYVANLDEAAVAGIIRYCGIALRNRDSSLVSFSDATETGRVRENFLKKKLALTDPDEELDRAIAAVGDRMKEDRTKNRVTVYYLLAEHFGKLGLFGGGAAAGTASAAGAAALADDDDKIDAPAAGAAGIGRTATGAAAAGAAGLAALGSGAASAATGGSGGGGASTGGGSGGGGSQPLGDLPDGRGGGSWFGKWWPWLLLALALIALVLLLKSCQNREAGLATSNTTLENLSGNDAGIVSDADLANVTDGNLSGTAGEELGNVSGNAAGAATAAAEPAGAAVLAEARNGLPALTVYFDTGKSNVASGFAEKAADVKAYVAAHPGAKLAVSGFNDATGNAALNAELSKNRAQAVAAALKAAGIPEDAVVLEKPAETTAAAGSSAAARRVEVTVKQ